MSQMENPEINPNTFENLVHDKGGTLNNVKGGKGR